MRGDGTIRSNEEVACIAGVRHGFVVNAILSGKQDDVRVLVLGAGFGGLNFCRDFKADGARVTLVDRQNHHLFQPLLYQVATAGLGATDIAQPIRALLHNRKCIDILMDEVERIDLKNKEVQLRMASEPLGYDYLVIGLGVRNGYFGNDHWEEHAPGLKNLADATRIRREVLLAFERAECCADADLRRELMTVVVVGGGPTGVELAGACAELTRIGLKGNFRNINPAKEARIILVEAADRLLGMFSEKQSAYTREQLERLGVEVRLGKMVKNIGENVLQVGDEDIRAANILWAAGVEAEPAGRNSGVETDRMGRLVVNPDLSLPGHPEVFVIGDIAKVIDANGVLVPGVAPAAMQMGKHVAAILSREIALERVGLKGKMTGVRKPFAYVNKGMMATIGRSHAVATSMGIRFQGMLAWLAWLVIHLLFLVGFRNRAVVLLNWCWSYYSYRFGTRIILHPPGVPPDRAVADKEQEKSGKP